MNSFKHERTKEANFELEKSQEDFQELTKVWKSVFIWVILTLKETGVMQETMYMQWLMLQQEIPDDYVIATGRWLV